MERICAIFSHYRRISLTEMCLQKLAQQTVPPHRVVVADNGAGDGSLDGVKEQAAAGAYPFMLEIIDMPGNTGNAGGIARGLERAFSFPDVDAVWILDDSWPEPDAWPAFVPWTRNGRHGMAVRQGLQGSGPETGRRTLLAHGAPGRKGRTAHSCNKR